MEEDFKKPILPGPQKKPEEKAADDKKVQSECPYTVPVSNKKIFKNFSKIKFLFRNGRDHSLQVNTVLKCLKME